MILPRATRFREFGREESWRKFTTGSSLWMCPEGFRRKPKPAFRGNTEGLSLPAGASGRVTDPTISCLLRRRTRISIYRRLPSIAFFQANDPGPSVFEFASFGGTLGTERQIVGFESWVCTSRDVCVLRSEP